MARGQGTDQRLWIAEQPAPQPSRRRYEIRERDVRIPVQLRWLDRWLRHDRNGIDDEPPVQIFVQGPDQCRYEHDWPLPDERRVRLYLSEAISGTVTSRDDGTLAAEPPTCSDQARYDFDPVRSANPAAVSIPSITLVADGMPAIAPPNLPPGAARVHPVHCSGRRHRPVDGHRLGKDRHSPSTRSQ